MTLVEFLTARLDEDEQVARDNSAGHGLADGWPDYRTFDGDDLDRADKYVEHFRPARVLADVESKRRIIAEHTTSEASEFEGKSYTLTWCPTCRSDGECPTLCLLALPYAEHPDYLPEWALPTVGDATTYPPPPQVPDR